MESLGEKINQNDNTVVLLFSTMTESPRVIQNGVRKYWFQCDRNRAFIGTIFNQYEFSCAL